MQNRGLSPPGRAQRSPPQSDTELDASAPFVSPEGTKATTNVVKEEVRGDKLAKFVVFPQRVLFPCVSTASVHDRSTMGRTTKQELRDSCMASHLGRHVAMEANPKRVIMSQANKKASTSISDNIVKLSWFLPDASLLTSGCNPPQSADRNYRIADPSTDDDNEGMGNDDDPPPLGEVPMEKP